MTIPPPTPPADPVKVPNYPKADTLKAVIRDLQRQATEERSHFYVARVLQMMLDYIAFVESVTFAPVPAPAHAGVLRERVEQIIAYYTCNEGWEIVELADRILSALPTPADGEDAARLAEALDRMVQLAQENWSSKEYYQSNPQKHVVVYRLWQLMREALAAHRDAKGEK